MQTGNTRNISLLMNSLENQAHLLVKITSIFHSTFERNFLIIDGEKKTYEKQLEMKRREMRCTSSPPSFYFSFQFLFCSLIYKNIYQQKQISFNKIQKIDLQQKQENNYHYKTSTQCDL